MVSIAYVKISGCFKPTGLLMMGSALKALNILSDNDVDTVAKRARIVPYFDWPQEVS
jgi:hypothetical protein